MHSYIACIDSQEANLCIAKRLVIPGVGVEGGCICKECIEMVVRDSGFCALAKHGQIRNSVGLHHIEDEKITETQMINTANTC